MKRYHVEFRPSEHRYNPQWAVCNEAGALCWCYALESAQHVADLMNSGWAYEHSSLCSNSVTVGDNFTTSYLGDCLSGLVPSEDSETLAGDAMALKAKETGFTGASGSGSPNKSSSMKTLPNGGVILSSLPDEDDDMREARI